MKNKSLFAATGIAMVLIVVLALNCRGILSFRTKSISKDLNALPKQTKAGGSWEFNRLKDPITGKIPADVHEREMNFVTEMRQQSDKEKETHGAANTYASVGPNNQGGRTRAIAYDVNGGYILAAGVTGGVFKSTNDGASWTQTDIPDVNYTVTCITQDPRPGYTNTWYYGTGEANSTDRTDYGNGDTETIPGDGIWMSTNSGASWSIILAPNPTTCSSYINRIVVDPSSGSVYAAEMGGIYKGVWVGSTLKWSLVLGVANDQNQSDYTDVVVTSGGWVIAAFSGNTTASNNVIWGGVWESTTGASGSWTQLAGNGGVASSFGWPGYWNYGRVVLSLVNCSQFFYLNPVSVYVAFSNTGNNDEQTYGVSLFELQYEGQVVTTRTGSTTLWNWKWTNKSANVPQPCGALCGTDTQDDYCLALGVAPKALIANPDNVFIGGVNLYWSNNGFSNSNYQAVSTVHSDNHVVAFNPVKNTEVLAGCDGGIYRGVMTLSNAAVTNVNWTALTNGYRTTQYYFVNINQNVNSSAAPNQYIGGLQDNGTMMYNGSLNQVSVGGGDGNCVGLDNIGTQYYILNISGHNFWRNDLNGNAVDITPAVLTNQTYYNFLPGLFMLDQSNTAQSNVMYIPAAIYNPNMSGGFEGILLMAKNALSITSGSGLGWTVLSPVFESNVTAIAEETNFPYTANGGPNPSKVLYVGTQDGAIYRITDPQNFYGQLTSKEIRLPQVGDGFISSISVNPLYPGTVIFTESNYNSHVGVGYTTTALSATPTWQNVTGNLSTLSIRSSAIAYGAAGAEYIVGTSAGLYSIKQMPASGSPVWSQEGAGTVGFATVNSLSYRYADNKLLIGTHGNGMYLGTLGTGSSPMLSGIEDKGNGKNETAITVYPNPARSQDVTVSFTLTEPRLARVQILNAGGKLVYSSLQEFAEGNNTCTLPTSGLPGGVYSVMIDGLPVKRVVFLK